MHVRHSRLTPTKIVWFAWELSHRKFYSSIILAIRFLCENINTTSAYYRAKCYIYIFCALAEISNRHKKYQQGVALCWSRVRLESWPPYSILLSIPSIGAHASPYIPRRTWGTKWMVLYLGSSFLPWASVFFFQAPLVLLCLVARGQQNHNHSLTPLL